MDGDGDVHFCYDWFGVAPFRTIACLVTDRHNTSPQFVYSNDTWHDTLNTLNYRSYVHVYAYS